MSELTHGSHQGAPAPGLGWIKASLSFANGNCVEVAGLPGGQVGVRHSKDAEGLLLQFTRDEWHAFLGGVRNGEFDHFVRLRSLQVGDFSLLPRLVVEKTEGEGSDRSGAFALYYAAGRPGGTAGRDTRLSATLSECGVWAAVVGVFR